MKNIFNLLSQALGSRMNCFYGILFSNLKKKEHNIIIGRVISNHICPMYIETPYIYIYIYIYIIIIIIIKMAQYSVICIRVLHLMFRENQVISRPNLMTINYKTIIIRWKSLIP